MYYLETNSLRTLLPRLKEDEFRNNSFTSITSIIELVTGITSAKEFQIRKNILDKVVQSGIGVDFVLPEDRFFKSFGIHVIPDHKPFTIDIVKTLITIGDYNQIDQAFADAGLTEYWSHFKKLDKMGEETFKDNFKGKSKLFKESYSDGKDSHNQRWDVDYKQQEIKLFLQPVIRSYAEHIALVEELNIKGRSVEELILAYNGSCNKYMAASNYYADLKVIFGTDPGTNDYFDMNHISYLEDDQVIIVTDDKMINKICTKLFPNQILRTKDI